jgi:tRNA modification GTPase
MGEPTEQTAAALHTPPGMGGIAVILLSGPRAGKILSRVFRPLRSAPSRGEGSLRLGRLVCEGEPIDEAIVCRGEGGWEINIHGGPAAARATLEALRRHGATIVAGGEGPPGGLAPAHPRWNNPAIGREMLDVLPEARSGLVVAVISRQWFDGISRLAGQYLASSGDEQAAAQLRSAAEGHPLFRRMLEPCEVVLAGPPNAGKSALMNALVGRQVSIVHAQAGTTRDWVRELSLFGGVPIWLTDTAGIWQAPAAVDAEAVRRARQRAEAGDLVLLVGEGGPVQAPPWLHTQRVLHVAAKCDLRPGGDSRCVATSTVTGQGLDALRAEVLRRLGMADLDASAPRAFTPRQARLLAAAADAVAAGDAGTARSALRRLLTGGAP